MPVPTIHDSWMRFESDKALGSLIKTYPNVQFLMYKIQKRNDEDLGFFVQNLFQREMPNKKTCRSSSTGTGTNVFSVCSSQKSINSYYFLTGTDSKHELYSRFHNLVGPWYIHCWVRHTSVVLILFSVCCCFPQPFFRFQVIIKGKDDETRTMNSIEEETISILLLCCIYSIPCAKKNTD